jgi:Spy/CpxP family protein refolding chaperone
MKVKLLVGVLVVLMIMNVAALGSFLFLHLHGRHGGGHGGDRTHRWVMRNVPEQDRERLFRTMRSFHEEVRPLVEQTGDLESQLIASMRQDPVSRARVDSLLEQISRNRLEIARRATDRMIAMGDSLTPDERGHTVDALMRFRHGQRGRSND